MHSHAEAWKRVIEYYSATVVSSTISTIEIEDLLGGRWLWRMLSRNIRGLADGTDETAQRFKAHLL